MTRRKASRSQKLPLHGPFEPTRCVVGFNISFCPSVHTVLYSSFVRSSCLFNFVSLLFFESSFSNISPFLQNLCRYYLILSQIVILHCSLHSGLKTVYLELKGLYVVQAVKACEGNLLFLDHCIKKLEHLFR